ncbi:hypothetical protein AQJ46_07035 [Streptomyces canus]|uniref:DUF397 domain-containing protein n=1 Tax=Streptomyces canus TaxID=58343 RepID=A0A101SH19_9ACTN|nr:MULTISPECIES: DUF397 domain-containing protein [Streptomyces]KUN73493.1 hypothetical protein AQJ46_07035 [Streptomyces canus]MDI5906558.1 DUF397 domain-containing protein [Streptomyces sp. 12257]
MSTRENWRKSSYSGGGDGNACVEIATRPTHIAIRDSKTPTRATLTFQPGTFTTFLEALKSPHSTAR